MLKVAEGPGFLHAKGMDAPRRVPPVSTSPRLIKLLLFIGDYCKSISMFLLLKENTGSFFFPGSTTLSEVNFAS